ncbi:M50 family metallopeptidase [Luedemannella flava]
MSTDDQPARRGLRLATVGGVPVYLNATWLLLAGLLVLMYGQLPSAAGTGPGAYAMGVAFVVCLLLSVLLHELGHALTARRWRIQVHAITLDLFGGYTEMDARSPSAGADLLVSLAGPVVSALIGFGALGAALAQPDAGLLRELTWQVAISNLLVAVFNALPGMPLDGGRILRAVIWAVTGDPHKGSRVAGWCGVVVAVGSVVVGVLAYANRWVGLLGVGFTVMIAVILWRGAWASIRAGHVAARLAGLRLGSLVSPLVAVPAGMPLAEAQLRGGGAALGVTDVHGRLVALVHDDAAAAVPVERRGSVPVESVARTLDPGRTSLWNFPGRTWCGPCG